jgi:two-component system chemotaxis sensor kinase CheA
MQGQEVLSVRGRFVAIASLADTLKIPGQKSARGMNTMPIVVVKHGNLLRAYAVDELLVEQEVVVTNLGARLQRVRNISGATLLANGEIALIINAAELVRRVSGKSLINEQEHATAEPVKKKRLIVADDSLTTRILEASILEAAGYEVLAVSDGQDAWELLNDKGADLVVSDVEMPMMDGFALTRIIRSSSQWANLPVILVTGLSRERDRARGLEAGASAYVVKSDFEQTALLETIAQLV